jgi:predicted outer membrane repeat protein
MTLLDIGFQNCEGGTGGAISVGAGNGGFVEIFNCSFVGNRATVNGGAIYSKSYASLNVQSCVFSNNSAGNGLGGAIYVEQQDVTVTSSTFYLNSASSGAAFYGLNIGSSFPPIVISLPFPYLCLILIVLLAFPKQQLHREHSERKRRSVFRGQHRWFEPNLRLYRK